MSFYEVNIVKCERKWRKPYRPSNCEDYCDYEVYYNHRDGTNFKLGEIWWNEYDFYTLENIEDGQIDMELLVDLMNKFSKQFKTKWMAQWEKEHKHRTFTPSKVNKEKLCCS